MSVDAATALMMGSFYENLLGQREGLAKPMGKAAALVEAKCWLPVRRFTTSARRG